MVERLGVRAILKGIKGAYVVGGFLLGMAPAAIPPVTEIICSAYFSLTKRNAQPPSLPRGRNVAENDWTRGEKYEKRRTTLNTPDIINAIEKGKAIDLPLFPI